MNCRPKNHLIAATKQYPNAWKLAEMMRNDRGKGGFPSWPAWCYLPLAGWYAILSSAYRVDRLSLEHAVDVGRLGALGAWRVGQGIYRFDETLFRSLMSTSIKGKVPCSVLYFLPEFSVYVETPDTKLGGSALHGFFAHLEEDVNDKRHELRFVFDFEDILLPMPIHIGPWSLEEAITRMITEAGKQGMPIEDGLGKMLEPYLEPFLSVVLYLCSESADYGGASAPGRPQPRHTKQGSRLFPPDSPAIWNVGTRIGSFIRSAEVPKKKAGEGTTPVPNHTSGVPIGIFSIMGKIGRNRG